MCQSRGKPPEKTGGFLQGLCLPSGDTFRPLPGCLMGCVCPHKNIVEKGKCAGDGSLSPHPSRLRRATFPGGEGFGERIVTGGNPWEGPHQCEHWFAMTTSIHARASLRWHCSIGLFRHRKTASRKIGTRRKYARYRQSALDGAGGNALDDELAQADVHHHNRQNRKQDEHVHLAHVELGVVGAAQLGDH